VSEEEVKNQVATEKQADAVEAPIEKPAEKSADEAPKAAPATSVVLEGLYASLRGCSSGHLWQG